MDRYNELRREKRDVLDRFLSEWKGRFSGETEEGRKRQLSNFYAALMEMPTNYCLNGEAYNIFSAKALIEIGRLFDSTPCEDSKAYHKAFLEGFKGAANALCRSREGQPISFGRTLAFYAGQYREQRGNQGSLG